MKIVYLVGEFPRVSKTFVMHPIVRLIEKEHEVEIVGKRPQSESESRHDVVDQYRLIERTHYPPSMPDSYVGRAICLLYTVVPEMLKSPNRLTGVLRYVVQRLQAVLDRGEAPRLTPLLVGRFLVDLDYDVLHIHFGYNAILAAELRRVGLIEGPMVVTFHGTDLNVYPREHPEGVYDSVFEMSDALTVGSKFGKSRLLSLGAPVDKVKVMPMGIDVDRFTPVRSQKRGGDPVRILTVARLVEVKGVRYGIEAVARLRERGRDVQYWVAGDGPQRNKLETLAHSLGIEEDVTFFGNITQTKISELYQRAHLFLLPGVRASTGAVETQGVVLAEAQASGLPVVASNCGGIPESILDGESGVLVPPGNVDALVDTLQTLLDTPDQWPEMGRDGRNYVEDKFSVKRQLREMVSLYEEIRRS